VSLYAVRELPPDDAAPVIPFEDFLSYVFDWKQNQHVGLVGPTEQGKTNLGYHLLKLRDYITYLAIKTQDETLDAFIDSGEYQRFYDWPPMKRTLLGSRPLTPQEAPRRLLWPDATELDSEEEQKRVFSKALADIYARGGWCLVLDDYWYLAHILGFEKQTKKFLANARSNYIPMVIAAQRPAGNNLVELFDQTTHLFFFRDNDEPNLKRISGVGWMSANLIRAFVANLDRFQALYVNTRTGVMYRVTAPELKISGRKGKGGND
jgi:hypothetical protein